MLRITTLLICFILTPAALAQGFDYTFAELSYVDTEVDVGPIDVEGDGFQLDGSLAINPNFHAFASYNESELDDSDVDLETWELGAGYNTPLTDGVDFIARAKYVNTEFDSGFGSGDDDGFGVGVGIRSWITDGIELDLGLDYVDFDDADDQTIFSAGLVFTVTESIAVNLSGGWSDDPDTTVLGLGARWYFGI